MISEELILGAGVLAVAIAVTMTKKKKKVDCSAIILFDKEDFRKNLQAEIALAAQELAGGVENITPAMVVDVQTNKEIQDGLAFFLAQVAEEKLGDLGAITKRPTFTRLAAHDGDGRMLVIGDFTLDESQFKETENYITDVQNDPYGAIRCKGGPISGYKLKSGAMRVDTMLANVKEFLQNNPTFKRILGVN